MGHGAPCTLPAARPLDVSHTSNDKQPRVAVVRRVEAYERPAPRGACPGTAHAHCIALHFMACMHACLYLKGYADEAAAAWKSWKWHA